MTATQMQPHVAVPISTADLCVRFGRTDALHNVTFDVLPGSIFALIGANGAGKTTLIKTLLNILRPTSGKATVQGFASQRVSGRAFEAIGYVSENQDMPEWMTVHELLQYLRPFYPTWDRKLEEQLIQQFLLPIDRKIKHLSRGQRMKTALLSILAYRPSLIVLDEPFSGLDPLARDEFIEGLLDRAAAEYATPPAILISSHDLAEIESFATHVGFLDAGHLLFSEEVSTLTGRFREVTVTTNGSFQSSSRPSTPGSWLMVEVASSFARFVHAKASTESITDQVASVFPGARDIQTEPMNLRSIFVALAKANRTADHLLSERSPA